MSSSATQQQIDRPQILSHNRLGARTWNAGGEAYDDISRQIADAIEHAVDRLEPRPGERILDVATGTGWAARRIAERGAQVTGIDFSESVVTTARELSPDGGMSFEVADAEQLPYPDGHFDAVLSTFGVMFCARPERAAKELARVCKPGGRLALATWSTSGSVREVFEMIAGYKRAASNPNGPQPRSPFDWGDTNRLIELLGEDFDLGFEEGTTYYRTRDGAAAFAAFASGFGPVVTLLDESTSLTRRPPRASAASSSSFTSATAPASACSFHASMSSPSAGATPEYSADNLIGESDAESKHYEEAGE
jgi:SAM-dependent methyltransferase